MLLVKGKTQRSKGKGQRAKVKGQRLKVEGGGIDARTKKGITVTFFTSKTSPHRLSLKKEEG